MALIYCYRWSCYSWRKTTKSEPTFLPVSFPSLTPSVRFPLWTWYGGMKQWTAVLLFTKCSRSRMPIRFGSMVLDGNILTPFSPHMQLSYAQKRVISDAAAAATALFLSFGRKRHKLAIPILFNFFFVYESHYPWRISFYFYFLSFPSIICISSLCALF